jgi:DNA-binding response OmpR family regulator
VARILVVDDDPLFLAIMSRSLEKARHDIVTATDVDKAIELFGQLEIDALVCPLIMAKAGLQLIREARHQSATVAIIALTGGRGPSHTVNNDIVMMAQAVGADVVIRRPFEVHDFIATVEGTIAARTQENTAAAAG